MSKYSDLEKLDANLVNFVESYSGGKIYKDNDGFIAVKRNFIIDEQINSIEQAKQVIDHFNMD
jgi:hypothetical protein